VAARPKHDAEREREEDEKEHERDRDPEALPRLTARSTRERKRRDQRDAAARGVARKDVFDRERDGARVGAKEAAHEDLTGKIVEMLGLDPFDGRDGNAGGAGDFLHAHRASFSRSLQKPTDRIHPTSPTPVTRRTRECESVLSLDGPRVRSRLVVDVLVRDPLGPFFSPHFRVRPRSDARPAWSGRGRGSARDLFVRLRRGRASARRGRGRRTRLAAPGKRAASPRPRG
jgi:hypothetical protein